VVVMALGGYDGWVWGECRLPWCGWQGPLRSTAEAARGDEAAHNLEHVHALDEELAGERERADR
jgi:hypothetical protein